MFFAFDVDGTLTPSRKQISPDFAEWFLNWIRFVQNRGDTVLLVTGSDLSKTVEQLGQDITDSVDYCCNCLGNQVHHFGNLFHSYEFTPPAELLQFLKQKLDHSNYSERYGNHIEHRSAMLNFSVVGRNAVGDQRTRYYMWDQLSNERSSICEEINETFVGISAQVGGETGIDIFPTGLDKRQVMQYMQCPHDDKIMFFGDRMDSAGNDKPLADAIMAASSRNQLRAVNNWQQTWHILQHDLLCKIS